VALDDILRPALADGPCYVAFSGGRDSSAVLAAATSLARREGFADPVPVTERYPDVPQADESDWQDQVVSHLGLKDWVVLEFHHQNDLLGETGRQGLRSRGLIWPPALQIKANTLAALSPGWLLTGEGGDEVFGIHRAGAWLHLSKRTPTSRRVAASRAVRSLAPRRLRRARAFAELRGADLQPWLDQELVDRHLRMVASDAASEPWPYDRALLWLTRRRSAVFTSHNYRQLAKEHGITLLEPLLQPRFLGALGRAGAALGFPGRTAAMRELFSDVLPPAVIERSTKAMFNRAFLGESTREFARSWDGTGVDRDVVDAGRLRAEWLSERPSALSSSLLQSAWLASSGSRMPA
jgi:hypothetical protein